MRALPPQNRGCSVEPRRRPVFCILFLLVAGSAPQGALAKDTPLSGDPAGVQTGESPFRKTAAQWCVQAVEDGESGRPREALEKLRKAYETDPTNVAVVVNLADLHRMLGNRGPAIKRYRQAHRLSPKDLGVAAHLVDLLITDSTPQSVLSEAQAILDVARSEIKQKVARLRRRQRAASQRKSDTTRIEQNMREITRTRVAFVRRRIRVAVRARRHEDVERYYAELTSYGLHEDRDGLAMELGRYYQQIGRLPIAINWYRQVVGTPEPYASAAKAIAAIGRIQRAKLYGLVGRAAKLPRHVKGQIEHARDLLDHQDSLASVRQASQSLEDLVRRYPTEGKIHALMGLAFVAESQLGGRNLLQRAEAALLRAVSLTPTSVESLERLGDLYASRAQWKSASVYFGRALLLNPDRSDLHLRQSKILEDAGWLHDALLQAVTAIDAIDEDDPNLPALQRRKRALQNRTNHQGGSDRKRVETYVDRVLATAREFYAQHKYSEALKEIRSVPSSQRSPLLSLLEGKAQWKGAKKAEEHSPRLYGQKSRSAKIALNRALKGSEDVKCQARVALAEIEEHRGSTDKAKAVLRKLEKECRSKIAAIQLIKLDLEPASHEEMPPWLLDVTQVFRLRRAQERLLQIRRTGLKKQNAKNELGREKYRDYKERLDERLDDVERRLTKSYGILIGFGGPALLLLGVRIRRRFGGHSIASFIKATPEANSDVHRILSAIRHEVLKHNTTALRGLIKRIEDGDDIAEQAEWCHQSLIGDFATGAIGANERLESYVKQLQQVARNHRKRLNISHKDKALGAILKGFSALEELDEEFRYAATNGHGRRRFVRGLKSAANAINGDGYRGILTLLKTLRGLTVTPELCREIFDGVRHEPALAELDVLPLQLEFEEGLLPIELPIQREDFEDILRNPIRNAIQATRDFKGLKAIAIGLEVLKEIEEITGEMSVTLVVKDQCPTMIDNELLRDQSVESGLGLTRSLVSKYEGSVQIRSMAAPWVKAVAISLPFNEMPNEDWGL